MALVQCPDCDRMISDAAPACVGCGRPMSSALQSPRAASPLTHAQNPAPATTRSAPAVSVLGACKACGSTDVRRVPLVREEGTKNISSKSSTGGVGVVGGDLAFGGASTTTTGTESTQLAARLAPPEKRQEISGAAAGLGCVAVIVVAVIAMTVGAGVFFGVLIAGVFAWLIASAAGVFNDKDSVAWNQTEYPRLLEAWQRSVICTRCGAITDPGATVGTGGRR
jgi:hypothetical protein